jgi:hypothetical protein
MSTTTVLAAETYRGHEIAVEATTYDASKFGERPAFTQRVARHDGREFRCPSGTDEEAMAKLRAHVDETLANDAIRPRLQAAAGIAASLDGASVVYRSTVALDDAVWIFAMGRHRRGLVTKVGRTRLEVAYVTPSNPERVYRKSVPMTAAWVTP